MARKDKRRARVEEAVEEERKRSGSASDDDDLDEANEDLSLKIVEKSLLKRAAKLAENDNDGIFLTDDSGDGGEVGRGGGGESCRVDVGVGGAVEEEAVAADPSGVKKKKKKRRKKSDKVEQCDKSVLVSEGEEKAEITESVVETIKEEGGVATGVVETVDTDAVEISDNIVLRKLLRGPRYFDPPDNGWSTCYNCGKEGHMAASCPTLEKKKKPCYICGSLDHGAKQCLKGQDCYICKGGGHRAKDCPEKDKSGLYSSKVCLKCLDSGHDMFSCRNSYPLEDLKEIQCYVCKSFGHLCCSDTVDNSPKEVSCYRCGELGHTGLACSSLREEATGTALPGSCYKCGEAGHFARECTSSSKVCSRLHEEAKSTASPSSCYKCGEAGHFARECTNSSKVQSSKRNHESSNSSLRLCRELKDRAKFMSSPSDLSKGQKRKKTKSEDGVIKTPKKSKRKVEHHGDASLTKSKHKGRWTAERPQDSSHSKSKCRGAWIMEHQMDSPQKSKKNNRSPSTPYLRGHKISTITFGSHMSCPRSSKKTHTSYSGTPVLHERAAAFQPRFSAARFGYNCNANDHYYSAEGRRGYNWW